MSQTLFDERDKSMGSDNLEYRAERQHTDQKLGFVIGIVARSLINFNMDFVQIKGQKKRSEIVFADLLSRN